MDDNRYVIKWKLRKSENYRTQYMTKNPLGGVDWTRLIGEATEFPDYDSAQRKLDSWVRAIGNHKINGTLEIMAV